MKTLLLSLCVTVMVTNAFSQYTSCAAAAAGTNVTSGACLTSQNNVTSAPGVNCGGGFNNSNPSLFFPFTAGTCPQFDVTFNADEQVQFLLWSSACGLMAAECSEANANEPLSESWSAATGAGPALTNGATYILQVMTNGTSTYDICYNADTPEEPSNECSGAIGLSPGGQTFNNGGNCAFTGSYNDATTSDPAANLLCAGSLENTQWVNFQPTAGSTSFQIIGTNAQCGGPVCGWQFGIFSGTCASLNYEGCVSDGDYCTNGSDGSTFQTGSAADGFALTWSGISDVGFTATITETGGTPFDGTENFYLVMDGNANSDCQYTLDGINIQPLPIELMAFHAFKYSNANRIVWEVASEVNNDFFTVQRSEDGVNWRDVAVINGAGTSDKQRKYSVIDNDFNPVYNYYRLTQTDLDGTSEHSKVITVNNSNITKTLVSTVNTMGQAVNENYSGVVIDVYSDGTSVRRMQ